MIEVAKQFTFHAAHQLPHHAGECSRFHGHSYKLELVLRGIPYEVKPDWPRSSEGMLLDFNEIKSFYRSYIEPLVEHQNLNKTLADIVPVTTCECMTEWIARLAYDHFVLGEHRMNSCRVTLWETPTSYARVEKAREA